MRFEIVVVVVVVPTGRLANGFTGDVGWGPVEGEGESERRGAAVVEEAEGGVGTTTGSSCTCCITE